jgi:molecular chaperone HtpG
VEVLLLADPVDSFWVTMSPSFEGKPFRSVTQGEADLASIPRTDASADAAPAADPAVADFVAFVKKTLGDAVTDVRPSERLTESAVCLVAPQSGPDRQLEKLLAGSGRLASAAKPILEINPRHELVTSLARLKDVEEPLRADAAHLLLDQARVLDGETPADPRAFAERLTRVITRSLPKSGSSTPASE